MEIMRKTDFPYQEARRWCIVKKQHILICANLICTYVFKVFATPSSTTEIRIISMYVFLSDSKFVFIS